MEGPLAASDPGDGERATERMEGPLAASDPWDGRPSALGSAERDPARGSPFRENGERGTGNGEPEGREAASGPAMRVAKLARMPYSP